MATEIKDLLIRIRADATTALKAMDDVAKKTDTVAKSANNVGKQMSGSSIAFAAALGSMAGHAAWGALKSAFNSTISTGMRFNAMIEESTVAITAMLGSADKAKDLLKTVWDIASKTPFEYERLVGVTKQLIAMGFEAAKLPSMLWTISDAVAALGGGAEKAERMALNLGQINTIGHATGRELRELQMAGLNAIEAVSQFIGKSQTEVTKMVSEGAIDAKTFMEALRVYVDEKWGGMAQKVSTTYNGMISTLKDLTSQLMGSIMTGPFELIKKYFEQALVKINEFTTIVLDNKNKIKDWFNELFKSVSIVAKSVGDVLLPVLKFAAIAIYEVITAITKFVNNNQKLIDFIVKFGAALLAGNMALKTTNNLMNIASGAMSLFSKATFASIGSAGKLTTVLGGAATAAGLVAGAATAAGTALYYMNKYSGQVGYTLYNATEDVMNATKMLQEMGLSAAEINDVFEKYAITLPTAGKWMKYSTEKLKEWAVALGYVKKEGDMSEIAEQVTKSTQGVVNSLKEIISTASGGADQTFEESLKKLQEYYQKISELHTKNLDEIYKLTHSKRAIETRELEKWRDEQLSIVGNNAKMQLEIWTLFNMKVKALREQWAEEDIETTRKTIEEKERIEQEYFENNIARIEKRVQAEKEAADQAAKTNKELQRIIDDNTKSSEELFWRDISDWIESLPPGTSLELIEKVVKIKWDEFQKSQAENYESLTGMFKSMEEFLQTFDLEKFKQMAQKVIDISIEAAKFLSTLKFDLPPEVSEKIKNINKIFNEVTIGNLVTMIRSFTDFAKSVEESYNITIDPAKIDTLINNLTDFLVMFVSKTSEWGKALLGDNYLLPSIRELNTIFKDTSISEFTKTIKEIFDFMDYINKLEVLQVDPLKLDKMINDLTTFLVMFVEKTAIWGQALKGDDYLLPALRELNKTFKDTSINDFMSTLKAMFDLMEYINKLEYKPVTSEQLDRILTSMTEFMVLLASKTDDWIKALQKDSLLEKMKTLNTTFKDTALTEFTNTVKSIFDLIDLFSKAPKYSPKTIADSIGSFFLDLELFVQSLENVIINIGKARLQEIASRARETFALLNNLFKGITLDEFMKMIKSLDDVMSRFTQKYDTEGQKIPDLMDDVMNVSSRIKWFFTQLDTLAKELQKMFEGEEGKYLEAVALRVKESFDRLNNAFKGISLVDFTNFLTMLKNFEESVMKDKNGQLMTSFDIEKVKIAILTMLTQLEELSKELDAKLGIKTGELAITGRESWIDTLKKRLENTIGRISEIMNYVSNTMNNIKNSWYSITGTVTDIKGAYLNVIMDCVTGLNEILDSPAWKGIVDKLEDTYLKVTNRLYGIQMEFGNMKTLVIYHIESLTTQLSASFTDLQTVVDNADNNISRELKEFSDNIKNSEAVKNLTALLDAVGKLTQTLDYFVSKIATWIVAFTKFCFTISYLADMSARSVDNLNLAIDNLLKKAGAFKAFVEEAKTLMKDLMETVSSFGEMMGSWQKLIDLLVTTGASKGSYWEGTNFGQDPWDFPPNYGTGTIQVGYGDRMPIEDYPGYGPTPVHPGTGRNSINPPIIIQGDLVLQGVQNPQQLMDELKRVGNMRGAINVNYNY